MNLDKFNATEHDTRVFLRSPSLFPEIGVVRSNGHILVCVPNDGGAHRAETNTWFISQILEGKKNLEKTTFVETSLKDVDLGKKQECHTCSGLGFLLRKDCNDCEGEGTFLHGDCTYDCQPCNGTGKVSSISGERSTCAACEGFGEKISVRAPVGNIDFDRRYLALLSTLPNCTLRTCPENPGGMAHSFLTVDGAF